jgi:ABC-2 type transport system ATP-binding protein
MKVGEQAMYLAQLKGLSKTEAKKRLNYWFDRLGIDGWWNKKIQELSKGMAQKIQFVVTVLHQPKLLIFDEPFSGFDPINANLIKDEILRLKEEGATIIFSTHRMESVEEICDHIALIDKSNKILDGKLIDIKRAYKSNTYKVGISPNKPDTIQEKLKEKFDSVPIYFKSINDEKQYKIKLPDASSKNDLVHYLTSLGQLSHFEEVIPSVSDIFIETIQNN